MIERDPTDPERLMIVRQLLEEMTPAFKAEAIAQLTAPPPPAEESKVLGLDGRPANADRPIERAAAGVDPSQGLLNITVQSNGQHVNVKFDRRIQDFTLANPQMIQLAMLLLENCGAKVERRVITPDTAAEPARPEAIEGKGEI